MNSYNIYITFIILVKVVFILLAISHIYLKIKGEELSELDQKILYWKERVEFIFVVGMALLLIYLFSPRRKVPIKIDNETKVLLTLFGFILIIKAKWDIFFKESPILKTIQKSVSDDSR
jgi:uncharacterized BrkB/YihY/UPF0761 family membrane protein